MSVREPRLKHGLASDGHKGWKGQLNQLTTVLCSMALAEHNSLESDAPGSNPAVLDRLKQCLAGLGSLQATLLVEFGRLERAEVDACIAQAELAHTRAELSGTRLAALQASHNALHDGLTALPNRSCFLRKLDQTLANARALQQTFAVLFIDLNRFKSVNDAHGHAVGDAFLRIMASRLASMVRAGDIMSRFGGDEFACLIKGANRDQLTQLAGKLHAAISEPVNIETLVLSVQSSIGICAYVGNGATADELLRCADQAMYHAKRNRLGFAFHELPSSGSESSDDDLINPARM